MTMKEEDVQSQSTETGLEEKIKREVELLLKMRDRPAVILVKPEYEARAKEAIVKLIEQLGEGGEELLPSEILQVTEEKDVEDVRVIGLNLLGLSFLHGKFGGYLEWLNNEYSKRVLGEAGKIPLTFSFNEFKLLFLIDSFFEWRAEQERARLQRSGLVIPGIAPRN